MNNCQELLLTSLCDFYKDNDKYKTIFKNIIDGKHKLSLRMIDWLVTHYSKSNNILYWIHKNTDEIYDTYPENITDNDAIYIKKINLYLDYRAQLKSYAKINFDSFRRHDRISFCLDYDKKEFIETTIGQLNFFRWAFNNKIINYALINYDKIYQNMIDNNTYLKEKKIKRNNNVQKITKTLCTLRFD
jgi:hypothetical protein